MRYLVVANEIPWPLDHGGRLHAYEMCRRLARRHDLCMITERRPEGESPDLPFETLFVEDAGRSEPTTDVALHRFERYFGIQPAFVDAVRRIAERRRPDVVVGLGYRSLACLARLNGFPTICDLQDDEVLHLWRELGICGASKCWVTAKSMLAMTALERWALRRVDAVSVLAEADQRACCRICGRSDIARIPHGVDTEFYAPQAGRVDPARIVFWGVLNFGPNLSAILWFYDQVWPLVKRVYPELRWSIVGPGDASALNPLRSSPGIEFAGRVEDIRPHVCQAALALVPMVSGGGIKNKIMEAWAMARPVLCTRRALGSLPGVHGYNVWLADRPRAMAEGLIRLLTDTHLRHRLSQAGRATAVEHCSWDRAAERFEQLCVEVVQRRSACMEAVVYAAS